MAYLAPSILSADVLQLEKQIRIVEEYGADYIHVDVMDGHFVKNLTCGPFIVKALNRITSLPLDVHLMTTNPDQYIPEFARSGAAIITVHQEACTHLDRSVRLIKENNCRAGIAINPATPVKTLETIIDVIDLVLVMSVNPGFAGQEFIKYTLNKIREVKDLLRAKNPSCLIEVDGGINECTALKVIEAGADIIVAGDAIFKQDSIEKACKLLKGIAAHGIRGT